MTDPTDSTSTSTDDEPAGTAPSTDTAIEPTSATDPPTDDSSTANSEAARWRTKLREAEAQRDGLADQLAGMRRADVERIAAASGLAQGADVWLSGDEVTDMSDDSGSVDPARVAEVVAALVTSRPGLASVTKGPRLAPDHSQGVAESVDSGSGWSDLLKGRR